MGSRTDIQIQLCANPESKDPRHVPVTVFWFCARSVKSNTVGFLQIFFQGRPDWGWIRDGVTSGSPSSCVQQTPGSSCGLACPREAAREERAARGAPSCIERPEVHDKGTNPAAPGRHGALRPTDVPSPGTLGVIDVPSPGTLGIVKCRVAWSWRPPATCPACSAELEAGSFLAGFPGSPLESQTEQQKPVTESRATLHH